MTVMRLCLARVAQTHGHSFQKGGFYRLLFCMDKRSKMYYHAKSNRGRLKGVTMAKKFISSPMVIAAVLMLAVFFGAGMYVNRNLQLVDIRVADKTRLIVVNPDQQWIRALAVDPILGLYKNGPLFGGRIFWSEGKVKSEHCWIAVWAANCTLAPASVEDKAIFAASPLAARM